MKRFMVILLALPVVAVLVILVTQMRWRFASAKNTPTTTSSSANTAATRSGSGSSPPAPLLGETILRDYASTNLSPQNDLTLMSRLMENSLLLLKSAANRPLSANEDWAALFHGQNAAGDRFLPDDHPALNAQGQLIDRWGTPLLFHALGGGRYELRSAGPDREMWTEDDLHRNADGSFRRGAALTAPSLLEAAARRPVATNANVRDTARE